MRWWRIRRRFGEGSKTSFCLARKWNERAQTKAAVKGYLARWQAFLFILSLAGNLPPFLSSAISVTCPTKRTSWTYKYPYSKIYTENKRPMYTYDIETWDWELLLADAMVQLLKLLRDDLDKASNFVVYCYSLADLWNGIQLVLLPQDPERRRDEM